MLVLKKKLLIVAGIVMVVVLSLVTAVSISYGSAKLVPKYEKTVVIDAGHGGVDKGAPGCAGLFYESDVNLAIAQKLRSYFEKAEINVVMTRTDKNGLYGTPDDGFKMRDMKKRKEIIEGSAAALVISVHLNTFPSIDRRGAQVFFREGAEESKAAAGSVQEQLNKGVNTGRAFSALKGDYYILNCANKTAVIVECGFISNPDEEKLLATAAHQDKLAYFIFAGAIGYIYP